MSSDEVDIEDIDEEEELEFKHKLKLEDYDDELDWIMYRPYIHIDEVLAFMSSRLMWCT